jgi:hypothetical protein
MLLPALFLRGGVLKGPLVCALAKYRDVGAPSHTIDNRAVCAAYVWT